jgi:NTE family protein
MPSCCPPVTRAMLIAAAAATSLLLGCATPFDNQPLNRPITAEFVRQAAAPRDIVGRDVVGLSLSGGGMRAAAVSFGVLQALAGDGGRGVDAYDDLTFISSVSGGSLTAAYVALHGREALSHMRERVLLQDLERDLRIDLLSPSNLLRLLAGGLNDRSNLAQHLDTDVFRGATFADLYRRNKPDVRINATDLYNRTPFPFTPHAFLSLCSDLPSLRVSEAVAASMAVPPVFAPVVLHTFPEDCLTPLPPGLEALLRDPTRVATDPVASVARAMQHYRDPSRMRFLKLADGGLTDNQGLSSILIARALSGPAYVETINAEALPPAQARRLREMPTRLALPAGDVDAAIAAGREATRQSPALKAYLAARSPGRP